MSDLQEFTGNSLISADLFKELMETNNVLSGGTGGNSRRISIKGGRFREMVGKEQVNVNSSGSMNVVVLKSSKIGRTYFEGAYDPENPSGPTCWSPDSEKPSPDVPADKRKAASCHDCPMNIKGSGQGDSRACRFSVRLAMCLEGQYDKVYQMQIPATSIFGKATDGKMGMQAYARFLTEKKLPMIAAVTQMYFDENSETPKLYFKPVRPLADEEIKSCLEQAKTEEADRAVTMTVYQLETGDESPATISEPKAEKKADPKPETKTDDAPVAEPELVASKKAANTQEKLADTLSAWDD